MSELHFSPSSFPHERIVRSSDPQDRLLPFRQAMPLIFGLSIILWALLWTAGSIVLHLFTG